MRCCVDAAKRTEVATRRVIAASHCLVVHRTFDKMKMRQVCSKNMQNEPVLLSTIQHSTVRVKSVELPYADKR